MFAIRLIPENVDKIAQADVLASPEATLKSFLAIGKEFYFIRGFVSQRGQISSWTVLPGHMFRKIMDYDPVQIQTDWSQIVRKEAP